MGPTTYIRTWMAFLCKPRSYNHEDQYHPHHTSSQALWRDRAISHNSLLNRYFVWKEFNNFLPYPTAFYRSYFYPTLECAWMMSNKNDSVETIRTRDSPSPTRLLEDGEAPSPFGPSSDVEGAQVFRIAESRKLGITSSVFLILNKMIGTGSQ